MNRTSADLQALFPRLRRPLPNHGYVILDKDKLLQILNEINTQKSINPLKSKIHTIKEVVVSPKTEQDGVLISG